MSVLRRPVESTQYTSEQSTCFSAASKCSSESSGLSALQRLAATYDFWHPAPDAVPIVAIIASVAATSIGLVLILTGRTHRHEVEVVSEK